ncbi:MAG: sodium/proton-translocating pyrophosphatase, partial [Methylococcales bacterium]|nr:sodium/proton-translocating pyrophosphatase [Methylococcales bacterium]
MSTDLFASIGPYFGITGLIIAYIIYRVVVSHDAGTDKMQAIAELIHDGAMVFLKAEYSILAIFVLIVAALIFYFIG